MTVLLNGLHTMSFHKHFTSADITILKQVIFIKAPLTSLIPRYSHTLARNNLRAVSLIISLVFMSTPFDTQLEAPGCLAVLLDTTDLIDSVRTKRQRAFPHHVNGNKRCLSCNWVRGCHS